MKLEAFVSVDQAVSCLMENWSSSVCLLSLPSLLPSFLPSFLPFFFFFLGRVFLGSSGCSRTHSVEQADLELTGILLASAS